MNKQLEIEALIKQIRDKIYHWADNNHTIYNRKFLPLTLEDVLECCYVIEQQAIENRLLLERIDAIVDELPKDWDKATESLRLILDEIENGNSAQRDKKYLRRE